MAKKKTKEQFVEELHTIMPKVELTGDYINVNTKTGFRCLEHNCLFDAYPVNMLHGHTGCKQCGAEKYIKARSKPHEQFVKDVAKVNPHVEIIGRYVNAKTKVLVRCKIDGYEWCADPRKLLRGAGCAVCANRIVLASVNDIATTHPDFVKYFKNKADATKYVAGSEEYVDAICPECGYEKRIKICNLIRFGFACNECYKRKYGRYRVPKGYWNMKTMQEYLNENCPGYILLDCCMVQNDSGSALKALIQCSNLNHAPYWAHWNNVLSGYQCMLCYHEQEHKTKWDKDNVYDFFYDNGFTIVDKESYVNYHTPIAFCDNDGFVYMSNIGNMQKYVNGERKSFSKYVGNPYAIYNIQHFCKLYRPDYCIVSTEYVGYDEKHVFRYLGKFSNGIEFSRDFEMSIDLFVGRYCSHPALSMSNGECLAVEYFNKHKIQYIPQKRFDDCKDVYTLPFDFYLPEYNLVVEIMGEQHEHPVAAFGGKEKFEMQKRHDQMKRDYLNENNIYCLDIWYYEFNKMEELIINKIQEILNNTKLMCAS